MRQAKPALHLLLVALTGCGEDRTSQVSWLLSASPAVLDFGAVPVQTTARAIVVLKNAGALDLALAAPELIAASSELSLVEGLQPASCADGEPLSRSATRVEAGGCARLTVAYAPTDRVADEAFLVVRAEEAGLPTLRIPIAGRGVAPRIEVCIAAAGGEDETCHRAGEASPLLDFGKVPLQVTAQRRLEIRNLGDTVLTVTEGRIPVGDPRFSAVPPVLASEAAPGQTLAVDLAFHPTLRGRRSAIYRVQSDDPEQPTVEVRLAGEGDVPRLCFDPAEGLAFGDIDAGSEKVLEAQIHNCGPFDFELQHLVLSGDRFNFVAPDLPAVVRSGESIPVAVAFAPRTPGSWAGTLTAVTDFAASAGMLVLRGEGRSEPLCRIQAASGLLSFGGVVAGVGVSQRWTVLQNMGARPCTVFQPTMLGSAFRLPPWDRLPPVHRPGRAARHPRRIRADIDREALRNRALSHQRCPEP